MATARRGAERAVALPDGQAQEAWADPSPTRSRRSWKATSSCSSSGRTSTRSSSASRSRPTPTACATGAYHASRSPRRPSGSPCSARRWTWAGGSAPRRPTATGSRTGSTPTPPGAGLARRFEVLNFAVAGLQPAAAARVVPPQGAAFEPDLVLYSATMLDIRLMEIHLCDLLRIRVDLHLRLPPRGGRRRRDRRATTCGSTPTASSRTRTRSRPSSGRTTGRSTTRRWASWPATAGRRASRWSCVIIPRVGKADAPDGPRRAGRAAPGDRRRTTRCPMFDLTGTFDRLRPGRARDRRLGRPPQRPGPPVGSSWPWPAAWSRTSAVRDPLPHDGPADRGRRTDPVGGRAVNLADGRRRRPTRD